MTVSKKARILTLFVVVTVCALAFWFAEDRRPTITPAPITERVTNHSSVVQPAIFNQSVIELSNLLIVDYRSTNQHDSMTSALAHQLIAEQLRTNTTFLVWASNSTKSVILSFIANGDLPIYGTSGLTTDTLQLQKVTVNGLVGLHAEATYDPNPTNEGPLDFIVEGGTKPTLLRFQNGYRLAAYQLSPETQARSPRRIGRMDWSSAVRPLDKDEIDTLASRAFHEMTGQYLASFQIGKPTINTEGILNPHSSHPDVIVTGNLNAKLLTPRDYVYPFAIFSYDDKRPIRVAFSGEMIQTSAGRGEFVNLFAVVRKTEAIFELGEKFLGQGTWEQAMLDNVHSLNTEQRGQVYRRIFQH